MVGTYYGKNDTEYEDYGNDTQKQSTSYDKTISSVSDLVLEIYS